MGKQQERPLQRAPLPTPREAEAAHRNLHLIDRVEARLTAYVPPGCLTNLTQGVCDELDKHLLRYMEEHRAVLLGYTDVAVLNKQASLLSYMPYLSLRCKAVLLLLRPTPGALLVGRASKLTPGLLCLRVLGGINAIVTPEQMPPDSRFDADHGVWFIGGRAQDAIVRGDLVAARVLSAPVLDPREHSGSLYNLAASLLDKDTGRCTCQPDGQDAVRNAAAAAVDTMQGAPAHAASTDKGRERAARKAEKQQRKQEQLAHKQTQQSPDGGAHVQQIIAQQQQQTKQQQGKQMKGKQQEQQQVQEEQQQEQRQSKNKKHGKLQQQQQPATPVVTPPRKRKQPEQLLQSQPNNAANGVPPSDGMPGCNGHTPKLQDNQGAKTKRQKAAGVGSS